MRVAYFDCFSGIAGNMILGALLDAGLSLSQLKKDLSKLNLSGYELKVSEVKKREIGGTYLQVKIKEKKIERKLRDILRIIEQSSLEREIKVLSQEIFNKLAAAEGKVHRKDQKDIHFHEVGALDAIIDTVGAVIGIKLLGIEKVYASSLNTGTGFIKCSHGLLPVPAPATLELLKGIPIYSQNISAELVTPTGAAIITTLSSEFGKMPLMRLENIGYGAGKWDLPFPNLLRVSIGEIKEEEEEDKVALIETNIDDLNPLFYDYLFDKLFKVGALDVFLTPILMKKGRPANLLAVIAEEKYIPKIKEIIFSETTTLGIRVSEVRRSKLKRERLTVETKFGKIRVKIGRLKGKIKTISPEYEDCKRKAKEFNLPLKEVYEEAKRIASDRRLKD